jgi:hypothetical protein
MKHDSEGLYTVFVFYVLVLDPQVLGLGLVTLVLVNNTDGKGLIIQNVTFLSLGSQSPHHVRRNLQKSNGVQS